VDRAVNVWENTLDGGNRGTLTVVRQIDGVIILHEEVSLAYAAQFGPDVDDVATWENMVVNAVDGDYLRRGEMPPP
jgi:hypothetical protein